MIVLNMLNTKYFILPNQNQGGEPTFQVNPAALGNAWFVSNIQMVETANEEFEGLANLDPAITALVHKEFESELGSTSFDKNGSIKLASYAPNRLEYTSKSTSDQFAVFSEIWYGPDDSSAIPCGGLGQESYKGCPDGCAALCAGLDPLYVHRYDALGLLPDHAYCRKRSRLDR